MRAAEEEEEEAEAEGVTNAFNWICREGIEGIQKGKGWTVGHRSNLLLCTSALVQFGQSSRHVVHFK